MEFLNPANVQCPYCGETIELVIDRSAGSQEYIEDCSVCCRPICVTVHKDPQGEFSVNVRQESES